MVAYPFRSDLIVDGRFIKAIEKESQFSYFWSDSYDRTEYLSASLAGCIAVTFENSIIYELQESYGILDWQNWVVKNTQAKQYRRICRSDFSLRLTNDFASVYQGLCVRPDNWMNDAYVSLLFSIDRSDFMPISVGLYYRDNLVAGEIGYETSGIYTSLTGFFERDKNLTVRQPGFFQLHALACYLISKKMVFWNLGHPHMQYKHELGSVTTPRLAFLDRFIGQRLTNNCINYEEISLGEPLFDKLFG